MKKTIFKKDKKYTFSDYFEMNHPTEEIVGEFGYSFSYEITDLPEYQDYHPDNIRNLQDTYYNILPKITLTSEMAKREFLIVPVLLEIIRNTDSRINMEYPIEIDDRLSGSPDYLIRSAHDLIVIEGRRGELDKGFNQLSVELIAMDKYEEESPSEFLYGAVSTGNLWKFGILQRKKKHIIKDIHSYRIPEDTEKIFSVLMGIVKT